MGRYRPIAAVVLAAGEGTRMRSTVPKVLHPLCGLPMLMHVVEALAELPLERIVIVVGHGAEQVTAAFPGHRAAKVPVEFVVQSVQRGTGDAVSVALASGGFDELEADDDLLVVPGDTPLLRPETLAQLVTRHRVEDAAATLLAAVLADPVGYGRIVRDKHDRVARVVEHGDADESERSIEEVNTSIYCFRRSLLAPALRRLSPENAQGEYYLTDAIEVLHGAGHVIVTSSADQTVEALGVNDRAQLAEVEAELRARINRSWMRAGVTMVDPACTYVDATVELASDVRLLPGTVLEGRTTVGAGAVIGPDTRLVDTAVGEGATVSYSVVRDSEIGPGCSVGPFAHLRAGTRLAAGAKIGDFVETKNARIGEGAKANHLAYLGDVDVGPGANVGAGTITANYDGTTKHASVIGARARTGSNSVLVAPVTIGDDAVVGAGAVVTHDVPPGVLVKGVPARVSETSGDRDLPERSTTREDDEIEVDSDPDGRE